MDFEEKHKLIEQTVQLYVDKYGMFTVDDLISEAWLRKQTREADKPKHVVKATKDACVDFLRRWYKNRVGLKELEIKIMPMSMLSEDGSFNVGEYEQDSTTELLKEDLYKQMSKEEWKIVEYRMQGLTYKEIAAKMRKKMSTVYAIHKRMQERMNKMKDQLLGD